MKQPGSSGLSREGYWILGILGLAFISLMIRLQNPYRPPFQAISTVLAFIAVPTVFSVVLVLAPQPSTRVGLYIRRATLGLLLVGIIAPGILAFLMVLAPVAWITAYLMARDPGWPPQPAAAAPTGGAAPEMAAAAVPRPSAPPPAEADRQRRKKLTLLWIVLSFTIVSLVGRMIYMRNMETSSLMFIGIPAILAALLVATVRPKSAMGTAMTGTTFVLLLSAILFGEGVICILMAAPIFYIVAAIIGAVMDSSRSAQRPTRMMLLAPFLLMSLEGTSNRVSLPRAESVSVKRVVPAHRGDIELALAAPLTFRTQIPLYFRMGFPTPATASGAGLVVGSRRVIGFAGGEGKPGELVMEIAEVAPQEITFRPVSDHSKIAHWLRWEDAVVSWRQMDENHAEVTWTLRYRRNLDPAWYFGPWERYATGLAANYLIDNVVTAAGKP